MRTYGSGCAGRLRRLGGLSVIVTLPLAGCVAFSTDRQVNYGLGHYEMGLYTQAIPPLLRAARSLEGQTPPDRRLPHVLIALGTMAANDKRDDLAADFFQRALRAAEALSPADETQLRNALVHLGLFYVERHRAADAISLFERARGISQRLPQRFLYAIDLDNLGLAFQGVGRHADANALSFQALAVLDATASGPMESKTRGVILHNLAVSYVDQGRDAEAEPLYRQSLDLLTAGYPRDVERWRLRTVLRNYADLLRRTARAEEARALERRLEQVR